MFSRRSKNGAGLMHGPWPPPFCERRLNIHRVPLSSPPCCFAANRDGSVHNEVKPLAH
jgi:hypothetical protein